MTKPKPTVQAARLQQLYSRLNTVAEQIKQEEARRQDQRRQQEMERVMIYGRLVLLAGLDDTPPELLLGILQDSVAHLQDAATSQRWQVSGAHLLARDRRLQRTVRRLWPQLPHAEEPLERAAVFPDASAPSALDQTETATPFAGRHDGRTHDRP